VVRAEPVAALYEQGKVRHIGDDLDLLEDQMCAMTSTGYLGDGSPDRVDAGVWALTELLVQSMSDWGIFELARQQAEETKRQQEQAAKPTQSVDDAKAIMGR